MTNLECAKCGQIFESYDNLKTHLRTLHELTMGEYRFEYGIPVVAYNKIYSNPKTSVVCDSCGSLFDVDTGWYHHRLRYGKTRFACPSGIKGRRSECCKKLQSITIKEIRSTPESRDKTHNQLIERWSDPKARARYGAQMKAKSPAWHTKRMAATLKTCLSGKQTKPEHLVEGFVKENNLPFRYTGAGDTSVGQLFPDFVSTDGSKIIIDVHGCYWHGCQQCFPGSKGKGIPFNQRATTYKKHGYRTITIWEHELKDQTWQSNLLAKITSLLA